MSMKSIKLLILIIILAGTLIFSYFQQQRISNLEKEIEEMKVHLVRKNEEIEVLQNKLHKKESEFLVVRKMADEMAAKAYSLGYDSTK